MEGKGARSERIGYMSELLGLPAGLAPLGKCPCQEVYMRSSSLIKIFPFISVWSWLISARSEDPQFIARRHLVDRHTRRGNDSVV